MHSPSRRTTKFSYKTKTKEQWFNLSRGFTPDSLGSMWNKKLPMLFVSWFFFSKYFSFIVHSGSISKGKNCHIELRKWIKKKHEHIPNENINKFSFISPFSVPLGQAIVFFIRLFRSTYALVCTVLFSSVSFSLVLQLCCCDQPFLSNCWTAIAVHILIIWFYIGWRARFKCPPANQFSSRFVFADQHFIRLIK